MDGLQPVGYAAPADKISIEVRRRPWPLKRLLIGAAAVVFLAGAGIYGDYWWTTSRFMVSTDDAYVQAHSVLISPKVSGYISEVPVDDNQSVHAAEILARIDPRDYQTALDQARANVTGAQASTLSAGKSPSRNWRSSRPANWSPRIRRRSSTRSRISSATPSWRRPAMALCRGRS